MLLFFFLLQVIFWVVLGSRLLAFSRKILPRPLFFPMLCYKIFLGWLLGWLYLGYYDGGDTFVYFQNARLLSQLLIEDTGAYFRTLFGSEQLATLTLNEQPRALFFAKIASILSVCSLNSYWLIAMSLSVLSFFACWWLSARLKVLFGLQNYQVMIPFLLYPSVVFWSSGLLKESLALALICMLAGLSLSIYHKGYERGTTYSKMILLILFSLLLWQLKYYYAVVLMPLLILLILLKPIKNFFKLKVAAFILPVTGILLCLLTLLMMQLHPNLNPANILDAIVLNHDLTVAASVQGGYVSFTELDANAFSFMQYFPKAVLNGLFAPLPVVQGYAPLHIVAGIENTILLLISVMAGISQFTGKINKTKHPVVLLFCIIYIVVLAGLITLASPNFGSLIRYRVAYLPFWLMLVLLALDKNLISNLWKSRKKTYTKIHGDQ